MRGHGTVYNSEGTVRNTGIWGPQGYVSPAVSQASPFVQGPLNPPLPSTRSPQLASSSMTYASQEYGTIERKSDKKPPGKTKRTFVVSGIRMTQPAHPCMSRLILGDVGRGVQKF